MAPSGALLGLRTYATRTAVQAAFRPTPFTCETAANGDGLCLRPTGELDISTTPMLEARLREARDRGHRRLVVDLRGLEFMDSTGLTLLTRWTLESRRDGFDLSLVAGHERIQRLFDLSGMTPHFTFTDE